eukprot:6679300-Prymnesium_polylepis.1
MYFFPAIERAMALARVELRLGKSLNIDELVHCRALPNAPGVGLAVQGGTLYETPNEKHAAVVEDAVPRAAGEIRRRPTVDDLVVLELALQVRTLDVKRLRPPTTHTATRREQLER